MKAKKSESELLAEIAELMNLSNRKKEELEEIIKQIWQLDDELRTINNKELKKECNNDAEAIENQLYENSKKFCW